MDNIKSVRSNMPDYIKILISSNDLGKRVDIILSSKRKLFTLESNIL